MIDATLRLLDSWYNEPTAGGGDRPKLLAKLAILELCGWLEGEFDRLARVAADGRLSDAPWVEGNIIGKNSGFTYAVHWRPMLQRLVGEVFVRRVEQQMELAAPGDLDRLNTYLNALWSQRCSFAHADVTANIATQQTFNAPSWAINQHRIISKLLIRYEKEMLNVLGFI